MTSSISVLGVIPARYHSSRFPGKPLALLKNRPMIQWVYAAAKRALPRVVVATDDARIVRAVRGFGGKAVLTPRSCKSGTDRMHAVSRKIKARFYVNIQGDEPLLSSETIRRALAVARKKKAIGTAAVRLDPRKKEDPNVVKVVVGEDGRALYFSRSGIPCRAHGSKGKAAVFKHLGIYVYPRRDLARFVRLPQPYLEKTEKLEQLRALFYGMPIYVAQTPHDSIGVDTPKDVRRVEKLMNARNR